MLLARRFIKFFNRGETPITFNFMKKTALITLITCLFILVGTFLQLGALTQLQAPNFADYSPFDWGIQVVYWLTLLSAGLLVGSNYAEEIF